MNKVIKSYLTKKYYYQDVKEFKKRLMSFILFYNYHKKLTSLEYQSPFSLLLEKFDKMSLLFKDYLIHKLVRLNS